MTKGNKRHDHFSITNEDIAIGCSKYTAVQKEALSWFAQYIRDVKHNSKKIAVELLADWSTITRVYHGKYPSSIDSIIEKIEAIRLTAASAKTDFISTVVTKRIWAVMDIARTYRKMVLISGASGRSKTHTAKEWCITNNPSRCIYLDCPIGSFREFLKELAAKLGIRITHNINSTDIKERIMKNLSADMTIVIDEASRLLPKTASTTIPVALEFMRRIHDVVGCGVVLIATKIFEKEITFGNHRAYMEQVIGRFEECLDIPDKILNSEIKSICDAFSSKADKELYATAKAVAGQLGKIRLLFTLMRQADHFAKDNNIELTAVHLTAAMDARNNLHAWPK